MLIGEIQADGQFETVWQTEGDVPGDAWSDVLPEDKGIEADWTDPLTGCGHLRHRHQDLRRCSGSHVVQTNPATAALRRRPPR